MQLKLEQLTLAKLQISVISRGNADVLFSQIIYPHIWHIINLNVTRGKYVLVLSAHALDHQLEYVSFNISRIEIIEGLCKTGKFTYYVELFIYFISL